VEHTEEDEEEDDGANEHGCAAGGVAAVVLARSRGIGCQRHGVCGAVWWVM